MNLSAPVKTLATLLVVAFLLPIAPMLHAQTRLPPDGHLRLIVHNGTGDGDSYYVGQTVPVGAQTPSGFEFVKWFKTEGDGSLSAPLQADGNFIMGRDHSEIAATFAKLESWFPPGPEGSTKGLLLPKSQSGQARRLEQRLRVTLNRGSSARPPYSEVWRALRVKMKWKEATYVRFFTEEIGDQEIANEDVLPKDSFKPKAENVYEASIWYEGNLTQEQIAQMSQSGNTPKVTIQMNFVVEGNDKPISWTGALLPFEMKVVDRDDPKKKWGSEKDHNASKPIYAGESCGDMVSWKLGGTDTWGSTVFTWTAEGPGGETKTGPTGAGKNEWKIADGDDDTANDWLKWKPGKWKIKVQIGSAQAEFQQEVGIRTEQYFVVGTIPVEAENTTGVSADTINDWACPNILYSIGATIGGGINSPQSSVYVPMDVPHRVYVNNRLLNSTRNFDPDPAINPEIPIKNACGLDPYKHYRWFAGCQFRFKVDNNTLAEAPQLVSDNKADLVGFTPLPCSQSNAAGFIGVKHADSGKVTGQTGDAEFSYVTKNRAGNAGQVGFKNLNGRELPWVFFRFRFEAKDDGLIDTKLDDGASHNPDGPDAKDYSTVPTMLVYRRYYDLQQSKWKTEQVDKLDEDRRTFFSIGNPVSGAPYVLP
ncbi:MAG: hypothetical protein RIQ71_971 [Verrucomicrobiota bacterium]